MLNSFLQTHALEPDPTLQSGSAATFSIISEQLFGQEAGYSLRNGSHTKRLSIYCSLLLWELKGCSEIYLNILWGFK